MDTQPLPATAQVASQQATFLARLLSGDYDTTAKIPTAVGSDIRSSDRFMPAQQRDSGKGAADAAAALEPPQRFAKPFQFLNLGILAYVGNDKGIAQLQVNKTPVKSKGFGGWLLWRSIYLSKQGGARLLLWRDLERLAKRLMLRRRRVIYSLKQAALRIVLLARYLRLKASATPETPWSGPAFREASGQRYLQRLSYPTGLSFLLALRNEEARTELRAGVLRNATKALSIESGTARAQNRGVVPANLHAESSESVANARLGRQEVQQLGLQGLRLQPP
eukprot:scaffold4_cov247-Pinguiococcus_pyrenoidosus.AAC.8